MHLNDGRAADDGRTRPTINTVRVETEAAISGHVLERVHI